MVSFKSSHSIVYRYDRPEISDLILGGSIRVSTLAACRKAENPLARDAGEGTRTTTSEPGRHSLNEDDVTKLFGTPAGAISIRGPNAFVAVGENAVRLTSKISDAFVLCHSQRGNDPHMLERFGNGCVTISDLQAFILLVDHALRERIPTVALADCVVDDVEYSSRTTTYRAPSLKPSYFVKPAGGEAAFEIENEVRAVWTLLEPGTIDPVQLSIPEIAPLLARA
jgi:hypothetical protein